VSLFKDVSVIEHATLQTRFEFFNVTNTPHFGNPIGDMSSSQFGEIRSAGDMRVVQAAVKVLF